MESKEKKKIGRLEVITGPMFSGKTDCLISRYESIKPFRPCLAFKSYLDNRYSNDEIVSHAKVRECPKKCPNFKKEDCDNRNHLVNRKIKALLLKNIDDINLAYLRGNNKEKQIINDIFIDEIQFLEPESYILLEGLIKEGINVTVSGLNWDYFQDRPFETIANLLVLADYTYKLTAECDYKSKGNEMAYRECDLPATRSMSKSNKLPKTTQDYIGGSDKYISVCINHYIPLSERNDE